MPLNYRLRPFCVALMLLLTPTATWASANDKIYYPNYGRKATPTAAEQQAEELRRQKIANDAQHIFSLIGAEIAGMRGQEFLTLNTYIDVLNKTKSPEVAERAMELAISQKAYTVAEQIVAILQKTQPESSPVWRRIMWIRALELGQYDEVATQLPNVLAEANEQQARMIFLRLAQASLTQKNLPQATYDAVYQASQNYPKLKEAQITSVLFSAATQRDSRAVEDLAKLAKLDTEFSESTRVGLILIVRDYPKILASFFEQIDTSQLPTIWQELELAHLLQNKKNAQALTKLKQLAENFPQKDFALRAALLSYEQKNPWQESMAYFNKAYQSANTQAEKSKVAVLATWQLIEGKRPQSEIDVWFNRIQAAEFAFDRYVLHMSQLFNHEKWQEIIEIDKKVKKEKLGSGKIFNQKIYQEFYLNAVWQSNLPIKKKLAEFNRAINQLRNNLSNDENQTIYELALYNRGLLYMEIAGQSEKGLADLRESLRLKPDSALTMNALGYSLIEYGKNLDEGFELIKKAYQKEPEDAAINDSMGWAYFKKGDSQTALPYLQFAYNAEKNTEVAAHLGEVYWHLGEQTKAREIWQEAWQRNPQDKVLLRTIKRYKIEFKQ